MDDFSSALDIIVVICGAYILYAAILMKVTGEIKSSILINKDVNLKKCKDLDGYRKFLFPRAFILGLYTLCNGAVGLLNTYVMDLNWLYIWMMPLLIVVFAWYVIDYRRGMKKYWNM